MSRRRVLAYRQLIGTCIVRARSSCKCVGRLNPILSADRIAGFCFLRYAAGCKLISSGDEFLVEMLTLEVLGGESVMQSIAASLYRAVGWALLPERDRSLGNVALLVVMGPSLVAGLTSSVTFAHWSMKASLVAVFVCRGAMRFTTQAVVGCRVRCSSCSII
ncbi:hypothetical protein FHG87_022786 [Trinorchestia longiramus]|nr:hypothetical protein FHG87_022786 [Trinorchestia longiramus]